MPKIKNLMDIRKGYSSYFKYSTIVAIDEEAKRTDMKKTDIVETAVLEYLSRNNPESADTSKPAQ